MQPYGRRFNEKSHWQDPGGSRTDKNQTKAIMKKLARNDEKILLEKEKKELTQPENRL